MLKDVQQFNEHDLFVVFRMPKESDHYLFTRNDLGDPNYTFVIHPFDKKGSYDPISFNTHELRKNVKFSFETERISNLQDTTKEAYLELADDMIGDMKKGRYQKVILSRIEQINRNNIEISALFENLKATYPNAFIYLFNIPDVGTWMGATPEILMERHGDTITTVALAATQKVNNRTADEIVWSDKEIEEQAIIQRYIESHLNDLDLNFSKKPTYTSQAGNVFHIKTLYEIPNMKSTDQLVDQLHPGPAICGMPQKTSKAKINVFEPHDRAFYCGYLGLKTDQQTQLFINLRCMQIFKDKFALYVGGGLTADSVPESEWEETAVKAKTLSTAIEKSYIYAHDV